MRIIATMAAHNEDWVIGCSLRVALMWCDAAVVLLHACEDRTREIVEEIAAARPDRVSIITDSDPTWSEMTHRQWMLEDARAMGATHIAIIDADEILTGNLLPNIREMVQQKIGQGQMLTLPGYNLRGGLGRYHASGIWGQRWFPVVFGDQTAYYWGGDRFHHREPMGAPIVQRRPVAYGHGGIMHLWGASERRLVAKHRAYKITERLRWPSKAVHEIDRLYSLAIKGQIGDRPEQWRYAAVPAAWWGPYGALQSLINLDAAPHQEGECERLIAQHGRERFAGLDLFESEELVAP